MSPGVGLEPSTLRMKVLTSHRGRVFKTDHVTHQKRRREGRRGERVGEKGREGFEEITGRRDGKTRKVYSQASQFGVGLEEKLREELELVSVQSTVEGEKKKRRGNTSHVKKASHCKTHLSMNRKGQRHTLVDHRDSCCCVD